jgi:hypothetical protein
MWEYLRGLGDQIIPLVAIVSGILCAIVLCFVRQWGKVRITEMEMALKADMIRQGRSADEIERILKMSNGSAKPYQNG